jgi:hypothetical protein
MQDKMTHGISWTEATGKFGPGWWSILGKIWTICGDHNWEVMHGRAEGPVRIARVFRYQGMLLVNLEPKGHEVLPRIIDCMSEALDTCEECGRDEPTWWGLEKPEERIRGRCRILCEPCWMSLKGFVDTMERIGQVLAPDPSLDVEPWFPGKDERDDLADGEEKEDWQT